MASGPGCSTHSGGLSRSAPQRSASQRSRLRLSLLIQDAYLGVAEEFCAAEPNFEALVASGAMAPQLAALLQAAATEARTAGQRATVDVSRVNGEVLFVDSMSGSPHGFVATVIFRSKEARSQAPHHSASAHHTAAANSAAAAEASADARAAVSDADAGADAAADAGVADAEYLERRQLWTFTGEHPPLRPYLKWIKGMMSGEGGDDVEPPVVWTLHDIDFAVAPYEQPELPPNAGTMVQHMSLQLGALVTMLVLSAFIVAEAATKQRRPPPPASFNRRERHTGSRADDEGDAAYERERERRGSARGGARGGGARGGARGGTQHEVAARSRVACVFRPRLRATHPPCPALFVATAASLLGPSAAASAPFLHRQVWSEDVDQEAHPSSIGTRMGGRQPQPRTVPWSSRSH